MGGFPVNCYSIYSRSRIFMGLLLPGKRSLRTRSRDKNQPLLPWKKHSCVRTPASEEKQVMILERGAKKYWLSPSLIWLLSCHLTLVYSQKREVFFLDGCCAIVFVSFAVVLKTTQMKMSWKWRGKVTPFTLANGLALIGFIYSDIRPSSCLCLVQVFFSRSKMGWIKLRRFPFLPIRISSFWLRAVQHFHVVDTGTLSMLAVLFFCFYLDCWLSRRLYIF